MGSSVRASQYRQRRHPIAQVESPEPGLHAGRLFHIGGHRPATQTPLPARADRNDPHDASGLGCTPNTMRPKPPTCSKALRIVVEGTKTYWPPRTRTTKARGRANPVGSVAPGGKVGSDQRSTRRTCGLACLSSPSSYSRRPDKSVRWRRTLSSTDSAACLCVAASIKPRWRPDPIMLATGSPRANSPRARSPPRGMAARPLHVGEWTTSVTRRCRAAAGLSSSLSSLLSSSARCNISQWIFDDDRHLTSSLTGLAVVK